MTKDEALAEEVTPAMLAAGWACLNRQHVPSMPTLGPGMGLKEAYLVMRAASTNEPKPAGD